MADGFLGRWSQRKQAVREGKPLAEPVPVPTVAAEKPHSGAATVAGAAGGALATDKVSAESPAVPPAAPAPTTPPALTLQDAAALSADSDYTPFVARSVAPEVRNAAMKKLFTDPHYNVMDGLDTYIDDYSVADPLPVSMLRQMASAKFLNLFDDEPEASKAPTGELAHTPHPPIPESQDDHTDLRLQPNHAAGREAPGTGTQ